MRYTYLFYKKIILRKSCAKCHYTNLTRPSDITLADFWGWEKTDKLFNKDNKGCSLVFCNTDKGRRLFECVMDRMNVIPAKVENCMQPNLEKPSEEHPLRDMFETDYVQYGFDYTLKKYGPKGIKTTLKDIKNCVLNFYSRHFKS